MSFTCNCANPDCMVNGCQLTRRSQHQPIPFPGYIPPTNPAPVRWGQTVPFMPVDEATVRRIVREEIAAAMALHLQGEEARRNAPTPPSPAPATSMENQQ